MTLSAIILTKNEEKNIIDCLDSLSFVEEIIIIDDNSIDKTEAIIKRYTKKNIRFYSHPISGDFSLQRNYGLEKATSDWVLFVDADERVTAELAYEIGHTLQVSQSSQGYFIPRRDVIWNKKMHYGEMGRTKLLRLARRSAGVWRGVVHERWEVTGRTGTLQQSLIHYSHQSLTSFLKDINYYTTLRANELHKKHTKIIAPFIIIYPLFKFIYGYIWLQGFRDGVPGLITAIVMSFHSFLVRGKLWQLNIKPER